MVALAQRSCIARRFLVGDYRTALTVADAVSVLAEEIWHHREPALERGYCKGSSTIRMIGGLHESDFVMATRIDAMASSPVGSAWLPPPFPPKKAEQ
jgi:pterin-4a-carbinolamine dehydratase